MISTTDNVRSNLTLVQPLLYFLFDSLLCGRLDFVRNNSVVRSRANEGKYSRTVVQSLNSGKRPRIVSQRDKQWKFKKSQKPHLEETDIGIQPQLPSRIANQ